MSEMNQQKLKLENKIRHQHKKFTRLTFFVISLFYFPSSYAEKNVQDQTACPQRPSILTNRWQENWDVLKNLCVVKKKRRPV